MKAAPLSRLLFCLVPIVALATSAAGRGAQTASADAAYDEFASGYFANVLHDNPSQATQTGVHAYDDQLDDLSEARFTAQLQRDSDTLTRLQDIDENTLSPDVRIDRQTLLWAVQDDLLINGELQNWRHNPDLYTQTASSAVYNVMAGDYAPLASRMRFVIARERQMPRLFAQAEKNLTDVDAASAEVASTDTDGAIAFFTNDVPLAFAGVSSPDLLKEFHDANDGAVKAVTGYAEWIKGGPLAHPAGTFAIGRIAYQKRLLFEDGIDMVVEDYLALGERALSQTQEQFRATAWRIDTRRSPQSVFASLSAKHPTPEGLIAAAQADVANLRAFVTARRIITLPADADITAVETPSFQRSQVFAAFAGPGPLEKVATKAYYYVTPPSPTASPDERDQILGFLNDYTRPIISAHEVMPGHFVNAAIDRHLKLSLTRKLLPSVEFSEGWAHYDEQMIVDEGWGGGDPRVRLAQLGAALVREGRFLVGVREHTQHMSVDQATAFLVSNAYMSPSAARREALRGTQDPMYGYYTLGKLMILKLRADYKRKLGPAYTLEGFHDALLAHGDPPFTIARKLLLGADDDGKLL